MRKYVIFFYCFGLWENFVNVCNIILVLYIECIVIVCRKKKWFFGSIIFVKLFCLFI